MSLKAQLEACRREYEANAEPQVVDAARRSVGALAETGLVANAVKAGEMAPQFRLRCRRGGFINLSDLIDRGPVVVSFFWGDWCPFCALELKALAAAYAAIQRLGAALIALSPQPRNKSSSPVSDAGLPFPVVQLVARSRRAIASPSPSRSNSGRRTWRSVTATRWGPTRKAGCCRYRQLTSSMAPAASFLPTSTPITLPGWSRPKLLLR